MEEIYKNRISWDKECEMFTLLLPEESGLPVSVYMDDGYAAIENSHPVVIFVQNSYNHYDDSYKHLICLSVDEKAENVFNTPLRITYEDYVYVRLWVIKYKKLIIELSHRNIDIFGFLKKYQKTRTTKKAVAESQEVVKPLNEMALLRGDFIGLPYSIWIDNGHTWKNSGHSPRIKVETTTREKSTKRWNPFILSTMEFAINIPDVNKYSSKDIALIKKFVEANKNFIDEVTTSETRMYSNNEVIAGVLTMEQIKANLTKETRDGNIKRVYYRNTIQGLTDSYTVVEDVATGKFSLVSKRTDDNVLDNKWYDAIIPTIKKEGDKEFIGIWNGEVMTYAEIKK